uniref:Cystatin domain-containing protein n=1 Tax=Panagrolaimus sp. PS1159 TaxID=55785 RepID=A0AC35GBD2_9BILA
MFVRISLFACFIAAFAVAQAKYYPRLGAPVKLIDAMQIKKLAEKVMAFYNEINSDDHFYVYDKVLEATKQLTTAMIYRLKLKIGKSDCNKFVVTDIKSCKIQGNAVTKELSAKNVVDSWEKTDKITFDL